MCAGFWVVCVLGFKKRGVYVTTPTRMIRVGGRSG